MELKSVEIPAYETVHTDEIEKCIAEAMSAKEQGRIVVVISLDGDEQPTLVEAMSGIDPDVVDHGDMPQEWRNLIDELYDESSGVLIVKFDSIEAAKAFVGNNTLTATAAFNGSEIEL